MSVELVLARIEPAGRNPNSTEALPSLASCLKSVLANSGANEDGELDSSDAGTISITLPNWYGEVKDDFAQFFIGELDALMVRVAFEVAKAWALS